MKNLIIFLLFSPVLILQSQTITELYIAKYSDIAVEEMNNYKIPASITLAQAILESGNGDSRIAIEGNNHFGIKCHDNWNGETIIEDDDEENECFRKYLNVADSYRDHSLFLTERGRYSFLFEYSNSDYKKWARGLKKAGYATNKKYPTLLIDLIKRYDLSRFDNDISSNNFYFAHSYGLPYLTSLGIYYFYNNSMYFSEINTSFVFSEANIGYNFKLLDNFYSGLNSGVFYAPNKELIFTPHISSELMYKYKSKNIVLFRMGIQIPLSQIDLFSETFNIITYFRISYLLS